MPQPTGAMPEQRTGSHARQRRFAVRVAADSRAAMVLGPPGAARHIADVLADFAHPLSIAS